MWSLKRKQQEVKDYYQATSGNNMWMVWILSAITFVGTILVVLALFWGGRWIYQKVTAPDNNKPAVTETGQSSNESDQAQNGGQPAANPSPSTPTPTPSTPAPTPAPSVTPQTGPTELVRTGPGSDE